MTHAHLPLIIEGSQNSAGKAALSPLRLHTHSQADEEDADGQSEQDEHALEAGSAEAELLQDDVTDH